MPNLNEALKDVFGVSDSKYKQTISEKVVKSLLETGTLVRDQNDRAMYLPNDQKFPRPLEVQGDEFTKWLSSDNYLRTKKILRKHVINEVVYTLAGLSMLCRKEVVRVRSTRIDDTVYIDMADDSGSVIQLDSEGWSLCHLTDVPVLFRCPPGMQPLPLPANEGSLDFFFGKWNLEDPGSGYMLIIYIIYCLIGTSDFPILILEGPAGSGKSSAARCIRKLVDPSLVPTISGFGDERNNMITFLNSGMTILDNQSAMSNDHSDRACRLSTGDGMRCRSLYTNTGEQLFEVCSPLVITSIDSPVTQDDVADRSITVRFNRISDTQRRTNRLVTEQFDEHAPVLMAGILDAAQQTLAVLEQLTPTSLPRMADFGALGQAAETVLGMGEGQFMALYQRLQGDGEGLEAESSPLVSALERFMTSRQEPWEGKAMDLMSELNSIATAAESRWRKWPGNAKQLGHRLNETSSELSRHGISFQRVVSGGRKLVIHYEPDEVLGREAVSAPENVVPIRPESRNTATPEPSAGQSEESSMPLSISDFRCR